MKIFNQREGYLVKDAFTAIKKLDKTALSKLVEKGLEVNSFHKGHCLLHWSILNTRYGKEDSQDRLDMMEYLLQLGANPNVYSYQDSKKSVTLKYTPLHTATRRILPDIVKLLIKYDANINFKDIYHPKFSSRKHKSSATD